MQRYINEMTVLGYLLADPRLHYFADGTPVLRICLETRSKQQDPDSDEIDAFCEHHDAVLYGHQAQSVAWSLRCGDALWLRGPLRQRQFKDGVTGRCGAICEIEARHISFVQSKAYRHIAQRDDGCCAAINMNNHVTHNVFRTDYAARCDY